VNFLQHIQEIDRRVEGRREAERQKSLFFGVDGDSGESGAESLRESLTTRYIGNNGPLIDELNKEYERSHANFG
jgi:hypothetical protein